MSYTTESLSLWELAVLSFLRERPMHPYEIQTLLKARRKDDILVLKRGSLYHAIQRLENAQRIAPVETTRNGRRPERTTYRITDRGEQALLARLRHLTSVPERERSQFLGALNFLVHLAPREAASELRKRIALLEAEIAQLDALLAEARPRVGRIHIIESEYARAMRAAELEWVRGIVKGLLSGRFAWDMDTALKPAGKKTRR
jgi:DNA-binding PadR family transcriptional regulator